MIRRRLVRGLLWGALAFPIVGFLNNVDDVASTVGLVRQIRGPEGVSGLPIAPFFWRILRYVLFYIVAGMATGGVLALVAHLLVQPAEAEEADETTPEKRDAAGKEGKGTETVEQRKQFLRTFVLLFAVFLIYVYLYMLTRYPALFKHSYLVDWFAGSPEWTALVPHAGIVMPLLLALYLGRKWKTTIVATVRRRFWHLAVVTLIHFVVLGIWLAFGKHAKPPNTNEGPNVILIALDSIRPDFLSWKGLREPYPQPTTPSIDEFLDDCVWFDQAYISIARTYPSWMSILTACWPPANGVRFDLPPEKYRVPRVPTLAQVFRDKGWKTGFFLDEANFAWMEPDVGFDHIVHPPHNALDFYVSFVQPSAILYFFFLNNKIGFLYDRGLRYNAAYRAIYRPEFMNREIADFVDRMRGEKKFFQAIHLCSIHVPFCVHHPYSTYFRPEFGPVPNRFGYRALVDQIMEKKRRQETFSAEMRARIHTQEINLYKALVRSSDDNFGAIIKAIKDAGLYDNSYIVFMADHGENLPEPGLRHIYGSSTHGFFLWGDRDTHVPLAIKFPKQQYAGRRVERLVRAIDIVPTLLDHMGMEPLEKVDGVSRMPDVLGESDDRERWVYAETGISDPKWFIGGHLDYEFQTYYRAHEVDPKTLRITKRNRYMPNLVAAKDRMIRTEKWKLIAYPVVTDRLTHKTELFDVTTDPHCTNDISTSYPAVRRELFERIWPFIEQDLSEFGTGQVKSVGAQGGSRILKD